MNNAAPTTQDLLNAIKGIETKVDQLDDKIEWLASKIDKVKEDTQQTVDPLDTDLTQVEKGKVDKAEFDELHRKAHLATPTN